MKSSRRSSRRRRRVYLFPIVAWSWDSFFGIYAIVFSLDWINNSLSKPIRFELFVFKDVYLLICILIEICVRILHDNIRDMSIIAVDRQYLTVFTPTEFFKLFQTLGTVWRFSDLFKTFGDVKIIFLIVPELQSFKNHCRLV